MKKFLLLLMAMVMIPIAMDAQSLNVPQAHGLLQRVNALQSYDTRHKAPAQMDLPSNQKILGHYDTDEVQTGGYLGLTNFPGVIPTAIELTPDELAMFQGGKIVAFRVGLASATPVTRVFAAPSTASGLGEFTEWSCNASAEGWNVIPVDPPYEINLDDNTGLFVGFDYKQTSSNYPISAVEAGTISPTYMYINYQGNLSWYDLGLDAYGNLSLQVIVESDNYPDYFLTMGQLSMEKYVQADQEVGYVFTAKNGGTMTIEPNALVFDVMLDGEKIGEVTNTNPVTNNFTEIQGTLNTAGLESGAHNLSIVPVTMNGEPVEAKTLSYDFLVYANSFPRQKHLIEQLTSTYCTYCPLGNSMLKILTSQRDDIIWVGIHGDLNSGKDPFTTDDGNTIMAYLTGGSISYPSGVFDRTPGWDDPNAISNGLGYNAQYHQQVANELSGFFDYIAQSTPTFATIKAECNDIETLGAVPDTLKVTVYGEVTPDFNVMMGEDARLNVYVVEDSLVARQLDNGRWISGYVHNGVFRKALSTPMGVALNINGERYENYFECEIPEEWRLDKLHVVAFISRPLANGASGNFTDMYVDNAEIFSINVAVGIDELGVVEDAVPVAYYDVTGRQLNGPQQGINIVKMSNGTAKKVLVK